ncbi:MAG: SCO1664 family protein [Chloroflexota bacterium]
MQEPTPPPSEEEPQDLTVEQVLTVLADGTMQTTHGMMRYSSNYTFLVTMEKGEVCLPAIYKPRKGERPLWDFPHGTLYKRERASFLTSEVLGWQVVPPTVIQSGDHGVGSVQMYIDHDPDINYFSFDESAAPQLARMSLFDALVNNADRKGGHLLLDGVGQIWGIDHGITFNEEHKLRTVIWDFAGQPVPQILMDDVESLCETLSDTDDDFTQEMRELLDPREMDAFRYRVDRVISSGMYPTPGPGPNYPWPAV